MSRPTAPAAAPAPAPAPRSAGELFRVFAAISMQSFGGATAVTERVIVQQRRWLGGEQYLGLYAISRVLPGPSGVAFCVLVGDRFFGLRGAAAALAGYLLLPVALVLLITAAFAQYRHLGAVQGALKGMGAAAVALVLHTAWRMGRLLATDGVALAVAGLTLAAVALVQLPVGVVVLTIGSASVAWAWQRTPR